MIPACLPLVRSRLALFLWCSAVPAHYAGSHLWKSCPLFVAGVPCCRGFLWSREVLYKGSICTCQAFFRQPQTQHLSLSPKP
jgi:hypothetical protein